MPNKTETASTFLEKINWSIIKNNECAYEQYQVLNENKEKIGLIRVHWGWFTVYKFNPAFKLMYEERLSTHGIQDEFKNETQRDELLIKGLRLLRINQLPNSANT